MTSPDDHTSRRGPVRCDRIFFHGLAFLFAAALTTAQAQLLEIRSGAPSPVTGRPGTLLTLPVQFINTSGRRIEVTPRVTSPDGWRRVSSPSQLVLFPGGNDLQLLILSIPREARVGTVPVVVTASAEGDTAAAKFVFSVRVERSVKVETILLDAPTTLVPGTTGEFAFQVVNRGNDTARLSFSARSSRGYPLQVAPRGGKLPPGATARIAARLTPDEGERLKAPHVLEFVTRLLPEGTEERIAATSDVVPRAPTAELKRHTFPVFATVRGVTEAGASGLQAELVGGGTLSPERNDRLTFLFRGPETQRTSVLGSRDEYRIGYTTGSTEVTVGDQNFMLTPLTDIGRSAFGIRASTRFDDLSAGGYVNRTRYAGPVARQSAGWLRYRVAGDVDAGVNVLHRSDRVLADIVSVTATGTAFRTARFDIEGGRSSGPKGHDLAYALRLSGIEPWLLYDLRFIDAGPDYGGSFRGTRFSSLSLAGRTDRDVRLEFSARSEQRRPQADTAVGVVPRTDFVQVGVGYTNLLTVSYRATAMSDPTLFTPYDRRQDLVELRSAVDLGGLFVTATAELGVERERTSGTKGSARRLQTSLNFRPAARQTYNLSIDLGRSPDPTTGLPVNRTSANLLGSFILAERTMAQVTFFASRFIGPLPQSNAMIEAVVEHVFPSSHRIRFQGRQNAVDYAGPETALAIEYAVPLAVPLGTDRSSGLVRGRIVEQEDRGVAGAVVTVGAFAAITDEQGRFAFNDLSPGIYTLSLDRASVGLGRIATVALPMEVNVQGGSATKVTLPLVRSSRVSGQVRWFDGSRAADTSAGLVESPVDQPGLVVVELTSGTETFRRVSDSKGRFSFTDLRPGTWTVRVEPLQLADDRRIADHPTTVDLAEGESAAIEFRILPKRRAIRLLQEGGTLIPQTPDDEQDEIFLSYLIRRAAGAEGVVVQVSSWSTVSQAETDLSRIRPTAAGRRAWIEVKAIPGRGTFHRVLVGPFPTREAAKAWARTLPR